MRGGDRPDRCGFGRKSRVSELHELRSECDYNISARDQLRGRYIYNKVDKIDQAANLSAFYTIEPFRFHLFTLGEYHTFSPSVINEFRVGFNRYFNTLPDGNFAYPGLDAFPNLILLDLGGNGLQIGPDSQAPQFTIQNLYQGVDNVSWTKGAHTLKFGGEYRWYISPQSFTQRQRGDYNYNSTQLFLEDFSPDNFGERSAGSITYYGNQKAVYWYVNDNWKVDNHLTLNLGIRYDYTTVSTSEAQQSLNAISNTPSIIVPGSVNQPLLFPRRGLPRTTGLRALASPSRREATAPPQFAAASVWPTMCFTTISGSWQCLLRSAPLMMST